MATTAITTEILNEFAQQVDTEKEYDLKELKSILTEIYKQKNGKKSKSVQKKIEIAHSESADDDDDDKPKKRGRPSKPAKLDKDGNPKEKKAPTAYNIFVKKQMEIIKNEQNNTEKISARELMSVVARKWKELTKAEQESYKQL